MRKKSLVVLGVGGIAFFIIGISYFWHLKKVERSIQGDPIRTVMAFMDTLCFTNNLIWNKEALENLVESLKKWKKGEYVRPGVELEKWIEQIEELESPLLLFRNKTLGKGVVAAYTLLNFKSYRVGKTKIKGKEAWIEVEVLEMDPFGLSKLGFKIKPKSKPTPFFLKRYWGKWYIEDIGGVWGRVGKRLERFSQ